MASYFTHKQHILSSSIFSRIALFFVVIFFDVSYNSTILSLAMSNILLSSSVQFLNFKTFLFSFSNLLCHYILINNLFSFILTCSVIVVSLDILSLSFSPI